MADRDLAEENRLLGEELAHTVKQRDRARAELKEFRHADELVRLRRRIHEVSIECQRRYGRIEADYRRLLNLLNKATFQAMRQFGQQGALFKDIDTASDSGTQTVDLLGDGDVVLARLTVNDAAALRDMLDESVAHCAEATSDG